MSRPPDRERLRRVLGAPELAPLVGRLRERLSRGRPLTGTLTLARLEPVQRDAVCKLLGRSPDHGVGGALRVSLDALSERLQLAEVCESLREAIESLEGPVVDRRLARSAAAAAWEEVVGTARRQPVFTGVLAAWLTRLEDSGLLRRVSGNDPQRAADLLAAVARVAAHWRARGEPLAGVAAHTLGDAHALDHGSSVAMLVVRAAAAYGGVDFEDSAEGRRAAWASVGIACDELSTPALVLNLRAAGSTPLARLLREAATAGEPLHVSLRLLLRYPLSTDGAFAARDIYICENPTIVALAAARLGVRCQPLLCVNGQPATPVQVLLRQLVAAGARLRYHGDFDWGGLQIARALVERFGAQPWRMGTGDYLDYAAQGKPLERLPPPCPWDPQLPAAMARERRAVHEELVAATLLTDLGV